MNRLLNYIKSKPHVAISIPALLCFCTFITNLLTAIKNGSIDTAEFNTLLSTADGFESVVLFIIMLVLKDKKK